MATKKKTGTKKAAKKSVGTNRRARGSAGAGHGDKFVPTGQAWERGESVACAKDESQ